jgi:hypothetical protein
MSASDTSVRSKKLAASAPSSREVKATFGCQCSVRALAGHRTVRPAVGEKASAAAGWQDEHACCTRFRRDIDGLAISRNAAFGCSGSASNDLLPARRRIHRPYLPSQPTPTSTEPISTSPNVSVRRAGGQLRDSLGRDPAQFTNSTVGPFRRGAKDRSRSVAMAPVEALAMLQVLAYELDECLLRVAVEQISGHHGAPRRRTVRTRCSELDMPPARRVSALPEPASRSAPRSTGTFGADALAAAPPRQWPLRVNLGSDRRTGSLGRVR